MSCSSARLDVRCNFKLYMINSETNLIMLCKKQLCNKKRINYFQQHLCNVISILRGLAAPPTPLLSWGLRLPDPPLTISLNMSRVGHDTCSTSVVHACAMIIVHVCTMNIVRACTEIIAHAYPMIMVHAGTMIIVHVCTMIIVRARTMIIVQTIHACTVPIVMSVL